MLTTVTNNSPQSINTSLFSLQEEIDDLRRQINQMKTKDTDAESELAKRSVSSDVPDTSLDAIKQLIPDTATPENQLADKDFVNSEVNSVKNELGGKADTIHTHTKSQITDFPTSLKNPNALTVNGKTYDGSSAVNAGVQTVSNGGTSATTEKAAFINLANGLLEGAGPEDTEHIIFKNARGTDWGLYKLSQFWEYIKDKISSVLGLTKDNYGGKANTAGTADKAVEVVDYGDTSRTVKIGFLGPGATAKNLEYLAGYVDSDSSSVKLKDVSRAELIKWLGISVAIKYADYRTVELSFSSSTDQKKINLSDFGPDITEENVINFMVIYWTGVPIIATGDWAKSQGTGSSGLACALHTLNPNGGTGHCVVRCVYVA